MDTFEADAAPRSDGSRSEEEPLDAAGLQRLLLGTETLPAFLDELVTAAARDTGHRCALTVRGTDQDAYTAASSDELTRQLDELQYADGGGPCLEALHTGRPVTVDDMATETRWPPYPAHAAKVGARSSLSYPLIANDRSIGALNFYAFEPVAAGPDLRLQVAAIAGHAAGALALALRLADRDELVANLRLALSVRGTIDQAIGILMAQQRCDAQTAFGLLRAASQRRNIKLRDVADQLVAGVQRERRTASPPRSAGSPEPRPAEPRSAEPRYATPRRRRHPT